MRITAETGRAQITRVVAVTDRGQHKYFMRVAAVTDRGQSKYFMMVTAETC